MEEFVQFSAKTKSEAITKACIELGTSSDQLEIEVVSEGSSGFFGIGSKPAIIKVRKKAEESDDDEIKKIIENVSAVSIAQENKKAEPKTSPAKEKAQEQPKEKKEKPAKEKQMKEKPAKEKQPKEKSAKAKPQPKEKEKKQVKAASKPVEILTDEAEIKEIEGRAVTFLKEVFESMDLGEVEIKSVYNREEGCLDVDFEGEDMGILIGKRGQTLDSLQYLTSIVVNKGKDQYIRVKLDTEDYRRRRKETLENLARGIAYKVKKTRKPVILEPMNPYERRIIHSALQGNKFVETVSEGEEPYRHIVVKLKKY